MSTTGHRRLLLIAGAGLLGLVALAYLCTRPAVEPREESTPSAAPARSTDRPGPTRAQREVSTALRSPRTQPAKAAGAGVSDLLSAIEKQAAPVVQQEEMPAEAVRAAGMKAWMELDRIRQSWPGYQDVRDELRRELASSMDLEGAALNDLRSQAAKLQTEFWQQEGYRSAQGYRQAYKARLLMEIAHEREPGNLAIADELVDAMQTGSPLTRYDPASKTLLRDEQFSAELRPLRAEAYVQSRREVDQGRPFTWADFARTVDYVTLWAEHEPQKAIEAFEWAWSHTSSAMYPEVRTDVLDRLKSGTGVRFGIYQKTRVKYPQEYAYVRRLPSYRGPNAEARGLVPRFAIGSAGAAGR